MFFAPYFFWIKGENAMNVTSPITGKQYDPAKCAYLSNIKQAYLYLRNDANLLDILYFNCLNRLLAVCHITNINTHKTLVLLYVFLIGEISIA